MKKIYLIGVVTLTLTGCISPIGKNDFACPDGYSDQEGVCAGPREIYELTNDRESLAGINSEPEYNHLLPSGKNVVNPRDRGEQGKRNNRVDNSEVSVAPVGYGGKPADTVYIPRDNRQQSPESYQRAEAVVHDENQDVYRDAHQGWPNYSEPLAPEPLAVIQPPDVMRVLVTAWEDNAGNLNMPGFVYVEVSPRRFTFGSSANKRPTRVVPFQMRHESQEEERKRQERSRGVSPIETVNPYKNN